MGRRHDPLLTLPDKDGVLYVRLYQRMRALILEGSWPPGMRLPSSRTLAADLGIARNTASLAIDQLLADGWVETRSRSGTYVSAMLPHSAKAAERRPSPGRPALPIPFELRPGAVDCFPFERWARIQSRLWARAVPDLLYDAEPAGDLGLRQAIADLVLPSRGLSASADDLVIVTSAQSAFDHLAATLPPGSSVVVENPGYVLADAAFSGRQLRVVPAPVDENGLDVDAARALEPSPALILVTAATQFPTGVALSAERRAKLLDWANEAGAWIVEEEYDAEARFDGAAPALPLRIEEPGARGHRQQPQPGAVPLAPPRLHAGAAAAACSRSSTRARRSTAMSACRTSWCCASSSRKAPFPRICGGRGTWRASGARRCSSSSSLISAMCSKRGSTPAACSSC